MEISVAKMNAMILMEESVCIRHYSLNSPMEFLFQVRELFIGSWKKLVLLINQKRKPNGITKADKEASKSDDLIKRNFTAEKPLEKCVTDMTEIKASDGKLYISAIFDCVVAELVKAAVKENASTAQSQEAYLRKYEALTERYEKAAAELERLQNLRTTQSQQD